MRKVFLNHRVWLLLSLVSKPAITIFFVLIYCLIIIAKPYKISKILRDNSAVYPQEIKLDSLL